MYRDYFQTDIEADPENDFVDAEIDKINIASSGELNPKLYDFLETSLEGTVHESIEDVIEDKIFKYKYRQNGDDA